MGKTEAVPPDDRKRTADLLSALFEQVRDIQQMQKRILKHISQDEEEQ